jgi:hypothetical protein
MSQENSRVATLKKKNVIFFPCAKSENRRTEQVLPGGVCTSGRREEVDKGCERMNTMQMLGTNLCK